MTEPAGERVLRSRSSCAQTAQASQPCSARQQPQHLVWLQVRSCTAA